MKFISSGIASIFIGVAQVILILLIFIPWAKYGLAFWIMFMIAMIIMIILTIMFGVGYFVEADKESCPACPECPTCEMETEVVEEPIA